MQPIARRAFGRAAVSKTLRPMRQCLAASVSRSLVRPAPNLTARASLLPTTPSSAPATLRTYATAAASDLKKTPLYDLHVRHGGKMVPFGGYHMPVQYSDLSVGESHLWTRENASIFDVSHMVQHRFEGPGAGGFLQKLTPSGLADLPNHASTLSAFLHPGTGGIVDDTVITRLGPEAFYVVTNAACRDKDLAYLQSNLEQWQSEGGQSFTHTVLEDQGLIAVQGPKAAQIVESLVADADAEPLTNTLFGQSRYLTLAIPGLKQSSRLLLSRGGYTGEDGFEISVPGPETEAVVNALLQAGRPDQIRLAGLGARDSLRLEAGMCLYGHDLSDETTPVEAGLSWIIGKSRRDEGGFNGHDIVLRQLKPKKEGGGVDKRRIGLVVEGAPAREGAEIVDADGNKIGNVTSGCPSPSLKKNIAMGYIKSGFNKAGTEVQVVVRGKARKAVVSKMPFIPSRYWKGGATPG